MQQGQLLLPNPKSHVLTTAASCVICMHAKHACVAAGILPDHYTYNAMLGAYAAAGDVQATADVFAEMKQHGVKPDHCTFIALFGVSLGCPLIFLPRTHLFANHSAVRGICVEGVLQACCIGGKPHILVHQVRSQC